MLLKIYKSNSNELKTSINITFLKPYIKVDRIYDILEFIESLDPIIKELEYENTPKDYRQAIIRDLNNLPIKHSIEDIYDILKTYKKLYKNKEEEYIYDNTIEQIRNLQKRLVEYTWYYYGVVDDNSYYLFGHQDNKFPFKAILMPIKILPLEIKDKFESLTKYGEYITSSQIDKDDRYNLSYFMMLAENSPSNEKQLFDSDVSGIPKWIEQCKFTYKPLYNWAQSRNEYTC